MFSLTLPLHYHNTLYHLIPIGCQLHGLQYLTIAAIMRQIADHQAEGSVSGATKGIQ